MSDLPHPGTRIWISGASSGIGKAMLEALAGQDVRAIGVARNDRPALAGQPLDLDWLRADLATSAGWAAVGDSFERELQAADGGRAILVHAAGTAAPLSNASHADPRSYEEAVLLNYAAPAILGQRFLRAARLAGVHAQVLHVTTGTTTGSYPGWSIYRPGKAAINEWVTTVGGERTLAAQEPDFEVYAIAPGGTDTPMQAVVRAADAAGFPRVEKFRELAAEGGLRDPAEVAVQLWSLIDGRLSSGDVVDVRDL